jgi:O-antigen/teichoic acid export membrane protein
MRPPQSAAELPDHLHRISRQSAVFFIGTIFTAAAGYLFKIYLARILGAEALGIYALGMTVGGLAGVLAAAGIPQTANRFIAVYAGTGQTRNLARFLGGSMLILASTSLAVGAGMVAAKHWIADRLYHTPQLARYMSLFAVIMFLGSFTTFLGQALGGYKDVARRTVITNFIGTPANMLLTVALLSLGWALWGYLTAQILSALLVLALLIRATWRLTPAAARPLVRPQLDAASSPFRLLRHEVARYAVVLFGVQVLEFVATQADRILLGIYLDAREVGIYSVAASLVAFVGLFLQAINQIFAPTIAELHARGERFLLGNLYRTLTKWTLGLTLPFALGLIIFAVPLMGIFGPDFRSGWPVLAIATLGQLVSCGAGSVGLMLLMSGQQNRMIRAQAIGAVFTVLVNLLLIPRLGIVGAAIAGAATNACLNLLWLREVRSRLGLAPSARGYLSLVLPTIGASAVMLLARTRLEAQFPAFVAVAVGLCIGYAVFVLTALRFSLDASDRRLADDAWARIRGMFASA